MPTIWDDVEAKCPYYRRSDEAKIVCEGTNEKNEIAVCCKTKGERNRYKGIYCDKYFRICPLYQMLEKEFERKVQSGED